jgi:hypothetical protein
MAMILPRIILAGGQTGVDQAAHRAAMAKSVLCAGWCPPGRTCETGVIDPAFPLMETPTERSDDALDVPRSLRTKWNIRDSDASLILAPGGFANDPGTGWAVNCAHQFKQPLLIADPYDAGSLAMITGWLASRAFNVLSIGGPSERTAPGIGETTFDLLSRVLDA